MYLNVWLAHSWFGPSLGSGNALCYWINSLSSRHEHDMETNVAVPWQLRPLEQAIMIKKYNLMSTPYAIALAWACIFRLARETTLQTDFTYKLRHARPPVVIAEPCALLMHTFWFGYRDHKRLAQVTATRALHFHIPVKSIFTLNGSSHL